MKIKVSTATGPALDWMVAKAEGHTPTFHKVSTRDGDKVFMSVDADYCTEWEPSTNWVQGGQIIEREVIDIYHVLDSDGAKFWGARLDSDDSLRYYGEGRTPLIAAMRCYVVSKLGEEVEVPDELI